jgi:hypothetical protein
VLGQAKAPPIPAPQEPGGLKRTPQPTAPSVVHADRKFDVLDAQDDRARLWQAGEKLGRWTIEINGVTVSGQSLKDIAAARPGTPLTTRELREALQFAVKPDGLLYFLDDVLKAGAQGLKGRPVVVSPSQARDAGIALSPDEALLQKPPHRYGDPEGPLTVHEPPPPQFDAAIDGDGPGPGWYKRFRDPTDETAQLQELRKQNPDFAKRVSMLLDQLRNQHDASDKPVPVELSSTVRSPKRGYLMFGAYSLSQAKSETDLNDRLRELADVERELRQQQRAAAPPDRFVDITWRPEGWTWEQTRDAAEAMRATFGVAKATKNGALHSNHIRAFAADITAKALPRSLRLQAPDGETMTFDLSGDDESRDLSLTPKVIKWINQHYGLEKLQWDYPHWDDARRPKSGPG